MLTASWGSPAPTGSVCPEGPPGGRNAQPRWAIEMADVVPAAGGYSVAPDEAAAKPGEIDPDGPSSPAPLFKHLTENRTRKSEAQPIT